MDNNNLSKNNVLDVIKTTNKVINGWIKNNNVPINKITQDEVVAVFKGNIKKRLIQYLPDFKRFSKSIRVNIDQNKFIENIFILDNSDTYFNKKSTITNITEIISKLKLEDYNNCKVFDKEEILIKTKDEIINVNLDNIKQIKF